MPTMTEFTPVSALVGGALIGLAAALLFAFNGRIAGVSGIVHTAVRRPSGDTLWRVLFVVGLIAGGAMAIYGLPSSYSAREGYPPALLVIAGLLVGLGTRMGSGCTSGHGVCGIARASKRSLLATATFLVVGMLVASIVVPAAGALLS